MNVDLKDQKNLLPPIFDVSRTSNYEVLVRPFHKKCREK